MNYNIYIRKDQLPQGFLGTPIWPPFHCSWYTNMAAVSLFLVHQYGRRSIVFGTPIWPPRRHMKTLYCEGTCH